MTKTTLGDLAILGGTPAFDEKLHVGRPNIGDRARLMKRIEDILDRRWLTNNGPYVQQLERKVAELAGVEHCIAVCNATVGLEIAIRALGLTGEVIVPAFTFVATAHALQWQEITPVFADIDPATHLLDPDSVERAITPRTTGILAVHLWGQGCDVDRLADIARRHGLKLLYDSAHAFGCSQGGRMIGGFGDMEVFSFHATKFVNSLEGGALVTNDAELARRARLMTNFGFLGFDDVGYVGTNGKMNEFSAAMGLTSIEAMNEFIAVNRRNWNDYRDELADLPGISLLPYDERERRNYQYVVAKVDADICPVSRDELYEVLWAENVLARRYFYPGVHRMQPYRTMYPDAAAGLPGTERVSSEILVLPSGQTMDHDAISRICEIIRVAVVNGPALSARLRERREGSQQPAAAAV